MKLIGKRSAGKPHAAFDVAEAGNMICNGCVRQSSTLPAGERGGNEPLYPESITISPDSLKGKALIV